MKKYLPHSCVLAAGILWGLIGAFTRALAASGLSVGGIVLVRNLGGFLLLALVLLCVEPTAFRVRLKHLPFFFGTGVVSVLLFTLCYFTCQKLCSLAVAGALLYTAPAFVVLMSAVLWKDKLTGRKLLALAAAVLGCTLVTGLWSGSQSVTLWGAVLGVASGFFFGLYSVFGHYALKHYPPMTVTFYTFAFAGAGAVFAVKPAELAVCFSQPANLWLALGLVVFCTVGPYILYTRGLAALDSGKASILASIEPATAALLGILAMNEPMSAGVLLGLACILASVYILR